jgi:hypothetical protein
MDGNEGSSSILKNVAGTHEKLSGIRMLPVLCLQDVQGQYTPLDTEFSLEPWDMYRLK